MSQSPSAFANGRTPEESSKDVQTILAEEPVQEVLDALCDADGRAILNATSEDALTASEISETCNLPLSTTYRKLDLLTEASLLEERTRVHPFGKHASEYARLVENIAISLGSRGETELRVSQRNSAERPESPISTTGD